jgi:hypothetical protein
MRKDSAGEAAPAAGNAGSPTGRSPSALALQIVHTTGSKEPRLDL